MNQAAVIISSDVLKKVFCNGTITLTVKSGIPGDAKLIYACIEGDPFASGGFGLVYESEEFPDRKPGDYLLRIYPEVEIRMHNIVEFQKK